MFAVVGTGPAHVETGQCQLVSARPLPSYVYTRVIVCMCLSSIILLIWNTVSGLWEAGNQVLLLEPSHRAVLNSPSPCSDTLLCLGVLLLNWVLTHI